jgi:hypothetical protein
MGRRRQPVIFRYLLNEIMMASTKVEEDAIVELRDPISGENEKISNINRESEDTRDATIRESLNLDKLSETQIFEKGVIGLNTSDSISTNLETVDTISAPDTSKDVENPMQRKYINEGEEFCSIWIVTYAL